MFARKKSHFRSVSSSTAGLNTLNAPSSASPGRRVQSWVYGERDPASRPSRPVRSFSAESLHVIPQTKDIDSQFQTVLGKCLFDQAVHVAEDQGAGVSHQSPVTTRGTAPMPGSGSPGSSRPASSQSSTGTNSPMMDSRTTIRLRPTRCTSPLVKGSRSFDSYINNGSLDQVAIAKARGPLEPPKPCIYKYIHRVKTASNNNLNNFSLKSEFTDNLRESEREKYWKRKVEEKIIEEEMNERKEREKAEMMIILEDMKKEYIERKAKEDAELRKRQEELDRITKENEEREALLAASIGNQCIEDDTISVISSSSKSSKKRSSKKGGRSKKDKNSKKGKGSSKKSAKKRASVSPSRDDDGTQGSGRNTPQPILKSDGRRQSSAEQSENSSGGGTGKTKRVTFRANLVSSKTFKSRKPVSPRKGSPKKSFPGSSSSAGSDSRSSSPTRGDKKSRSSSPKGKRTRGKGSKKGNKKKSTVDSEPQVEPPKDTESVPEIVEPEKPLEQEPEEPKEPVVIVVDEPPEFIPAVDYKTRNQMVEEWLYYRTISTNRQANPPIL